MDGLFAVLDPAYLAVIQTLGKGTKSVLDPDRDRQRLMGRSGGREAARATRRFVLPAGLTASAGLFGEASGAA